MKKRCCYIFLLCLLFFSKGVAQTASDIDSLLKKANNFYKTYQDSALYYAEEAYQKSVVINDVNLIAKSIIYKNTYLIVQKKYDEAEQLFDFNLKHLDSLNNSLKGDTFYNLGSIKYLKENYDLALENYFTSIRHFEKADNIKGLRKAYLQIGVVYGKISRKDLSNYFYDKSLAIGGNEHTDSDSSNIAPSTHKESEKIALSEKMLSGIQNKGSSRLAAIIYYNLGQSYIELNDYEKIIWANLESVKIKERINYVTNIDKSYAYIGEAYLQLNDYKNAVKYLELAYRNSIKKQFKLSIGETLVKAYETQGDYVNALRISKAYGKLKDSLNLADQNERIAKITAEFETEKQAQEIQILEADNNLKTSQLINQRNILWASALGIFLALVALFFAYKNHKTKQNLQFSELTRKLLQMQLNPHFLFNALNGIQYFIKKNDVSKSTKYITSFSGLMRNILENSVEKFISIQEDYDTISDFLELQQLVNNNNFNYNINIDSDLDKENTCIPPMITQPFVENAIIHGVSQVNGGKIEVNYKLINASILVEIIDNGKGIDENKSNANSLHKSMGTSITKQRLDNLMKTEKYPVELEVASKNEADGEQGTKVALLFPLRYL